MRYQRNAVDWVLEGAAAAACLLPPLLLLIHWESVPSWVPTHFDGSGKPDRWGDRRQLWLLPAVAAFVYAFSTLAARYPKLINLPFSVDRERPEVRGALFRMMVWLKLVLGLLFAYVLWAAVDTAKGGGLGLGAGFLPLFLAGVFGPLVFFLIRLWRLRGAKER